MSHPLTGRDYPRSVGEFQAWFATAATAKTPKRRNATLFNSRALRGLTTELATLELQQVYDDPTQPHP